MASSAGGVPVWVFWTLGLGLLIPLWTGAHFPSEDGLAHLGWTEVYRMLAIADAPWQSFYTRSVHWNTPNLAYFALQYGLGSVLDPHLAQRVIVSVLVVTWIGAIQFLSNALTGKLTLGALASLLLIHSSWLYGGYLSFLVGVPLLLLGLAVIVKNLGADAPARAPAWVTLSLLGVASYYSHLVVAVMFLLLVAVAGLAHRRQPAQLRGLSVAALPTMLLVASYLAADSLGAGGMRWEPVSKTVARFAGFAFFRGFAAAGPVFWTALALFALIVLAFFLDAARAAMQRRVPPWGGVVTVLAACLTILYLVAPDGVGDGYNLKGRFQLVLWAWLLPTFPYRMSRRAGAAMRAGISLLLGWQIATFSVRASRFNTAYDAVVTRALAIPAGSTIERELDYDHAAFDGSFIRVLAHAPEDLAYHCRCVLLAGYHPSTAFYWISTRPGNPERARYRLQIRQLPESVVTLTVAALGDGHGHGGATDEVQEVPMPEHTVHR